MQISRCSLVKATPFGHLPISTAVFKRPTISGSSTASICSIFIIHPAVALIQNLGSILTWYDMPYKSHNQVDVINSIYKDVCGYANYLQHLMKHYVDHRH